MLFPAELILSSSSLDGNNGFIITTPGLAYSDPTSIGDINNDGFDDFAYTTFFQAFAVYGSDQKFDPLINNSEIPGNIGFRFDNFSNNQYVIQIRHIGDFNNDGLDDYFVQSNNGFVGPLIAIFGSDSKLDDSFDLSASFDGNNAFQIVESQFYSLAINQLASPVGDFNGDGIDDIIAEGFLLYGADSFPLSTDNINNEPHLILEDYGIRISDGRKEAYLAAGDVNNDGFDDFILYEDAQTSTLVYGTDHNLEDLEPFDGRGLGLGDINGDGIDDLGVEIDGATAIILDIEQFIESNFDTSSLDGTNGFVVSNSDTSNNTINLYSLPKTSTKGDVNGDGIDDLLLIDDVNSDVYLIFGSDLGFSQNFDLASIDGRNGFKLQTNDRFVEAQFGGDINGDGVDDILVGGGTTADVASDSIAYTYVIYGRTNTAPVAQDAAVSTDEDTGLEFGLSFTDVDSGELSVMVVDGTANGTLVVNPDGIASYTPDADFNGNDSFTYKVDDGELDSNIATVTITVDPVNDAPTAQGDAVSTDEDTAKVIELIINDVDGDALNVELLEGPDHGELLVDANGLATYTPDANFNGDDSFTYNVDDGLLSSANAAVTVTVLPVNDPPTAADDAFAVDENATLDGNVLDNDNDIDGDPLTVNLLSGPTDGIFSLGDDGAFSYEANADLFDLATPGEVFEQSFVYEISDGNGGTDQATAMITVTAIDDGTSDPVEGPDGELIGTDGGEDVIAAGNGKGVVFGLGGADQLMGGNGKDLLDGGAGVDTLDGGNGNDTLIGGPGDDTVIGGNGDDLFVLAAGEGTDDILDFGEDDLIGLEGGLVFTDLALTAAGGDTEISTVAAGEVLAIVRNFSALSEADFQIFTT